MQKKQRTLLMLHIGIRDTLFIMEDTSRMFTENEKDTCLDGSVI